jgi:hypothetical protein
VGVFFTVRIISIIWIQHEYSLIRRSRVGRNPVLNSFILIITALGSHARLVSRITEQLKIRKNNTNNHRHKF